MCCDFGCVRKIQKRDFCTTILVIPSDSPFRATHFQPQRRLLRTTFALEENASHHVSSEHVPIVVLGEGEQDKPGARTHQGRESGRDHTRDVPETDMPINVAE